MDKRETEKKEVIRIAVENKVTLLMQFMASEFDDVSASVFDFARDYILVSGCFTVWKATSHSEIIDLCAKTV